MAKLEKRILWGLVVGVVVYAGIALWTDVRALSAHLASFDVGLLAAALGLSVLNYGFRFIKWHVYLRRLGYHIGLGASSNIFLSGMVMSVTPGKVGEVLKSLLLKERHGFPAARTAPVVLAERITDLLGLFVIAGLGIASFDYGRLAFVASLAGVLALIVVLNQPALVERLLGWWEKLPGVGKFRSKLEDAYASTKVLLDWKLLSWTTLISVIGWSMEALAFYLIIDALGAEQASFLLAAFIFAMTTILGAISFLPGGLGVTEASMIGVLILMGVFADESAAAASTYLIRFTTLWFGVLVGMGALVWFRLRQSE
ncbi:MAG: YbhN family protein [Persicimonas sp.]